MTENISGVLAIYVAPGARKPMRPVSSAEVTKYGIKGDRYCIDPTTNSAGGTYSRGPGNKARIPDENRHVTIFDYFEFRTARGMFVRAFAEAGGIRARVVTPGSIHARAATIRK